MRLPGITLGQLFVVEVSGWCGGSGAVLHFETKTGSAEVPISWTHFTLPAAVTDAGDDAWLVIKVMTLPAGGLSIKTIKVWKVG